ncbi:MAG: hypothetical protein RJA57_794 [Bacteroidota bacterium]
MNAKATRIPYRQTGVFDPLVLDYIDGSEALRSFHGPLPSITGMREAIRSRGAVPIDRALLVHELERQYAGIPLNEKVSANIRSLMSDKTFTVTAAHQNNLFTGPLYVIYKIIHAIRLADRLQELLPEYHFVPVFYVGSEDADLAELGTAWVDGQQWTWEPRQSGAVGRMVVDEALLTLIDGIAGTLGVQPYGRDIIDRLRTAYVPGRTIAEATFRLIHSLFADRGLVVLLPDQSAFKRTLVPLFREELMEGRSASLVKATTDRLTAAGYKAQAQPRAINLFYLLEGIRERIESDGNKFRIPGTGLQFSAADLLRDLDEHPERFSPNVILRPLFQCSILPDIAFVGGGGELAYWLQLKELFDRHGVPFPVLLLRNSFLLIGRTWQHRIEGTGFAPEEFFNPMPELARRMVLRDSAHELGIQKRLDEINALYDAALHQAGAVDSTLQPHVQALRQQAINGIQGFGKKLIRAEQRKFAVQQRQLRSVYDQLFPGGGLQERRDNFTSYFAQWGPDLFRMVYDASLVWEQEFTILTED